MLRLDGALVVVAGGRAVRRLKELLLVEAETRGERLVPPHITTPGGLPELLYEPSTPPAGALLRRRVYARVLRERFADRATALLREPPAHDDVRGWSALARQVDALHREIAGAGLRFADVTARLGYDDAERWALLTAVQQACVRALARLGFADADHARIEALQRGAVRSEHDLWLIGVPDLPIVARAMIEAVQARDGARGMALVHAPPALAHAFDEIGCVRPEHWTRAHIEIDDARIERVERPADQADAVVRCIRRTRGRHAADEVVVAVPDDEIVPYIEQAVEEAGAATRYAAGAPAGRTAPFRLLAAVADYLDENAADAFAALARHPDLGTWIRQRAVRIDDEQAPRLRARDAWLAPLDEYLTEALPATLAGSLPGRARARGVVALLRRTVRGLLSDALGEPRARASLRDWAARAMALLAEVYSAVELRRDRPSDRRVLDALSALREAALAAHTLPAEVDELCDAATGIRLLLEEAAAVRIAPDPERAAIELLGWLELHLDDAPVAIITGANEPHLPESSNADPFLPDSLRARLGLEDNVRRFARDAYVLAALLRSREIVHVIVGRRSAQGDPLRPSRLLLTESGEALARRVRRLLGDAEAGDAIATIEAGGAPRERAGVTSRFALPPEPVLRAAEPIESLAVTDFRLLLQDPYVFALRRILKLEPLDDAALELDPAGFGRLAHDVLHAFGTSDAAHSSDAGVIADALEGALDEIVRDRFGIGSGRGDGVQPAVRIQVEQLRARLRAFAAKQAERTAAGWRIVACEWSTPDEGVPVTLGGETIRLRGRIDRIDHHEARGEYAVFDYKTGERGDTPDATHRRGPANAREWQDLQLPLYRHLLQHAPLAAPHQAAAPTLGYILLCRDTEQIGFQEAEWSEHDYAEADACAAAVIRVVRANEFVFDPGLRPYAPEFDVLLGRRRLATAEREDAVAGNTGEGAE